MASMSCTEARFLSQVEERVCLDDVLRLEERRKERARIARELHDTLLQGFVGASMLLDSAVEGIPCNSPSRHSLVRALSVMYRVIEEGRLTLQGLRSSAPGPSSLETALSGLHEELLFGPSVEFRILVAGRQQAVAPEAGEQVHLIAREAVANALRHSGATKIEIELEYTGRRVKVAVRDNGCGMDQEAVRGRQDGHWGLLGMRERAESIGAQFTIWSRIGAGTEVEISLNSSGGWSAPLKH